MRLYIDDDSVDPHLIRLLRRDGHDVQPPADVGLAGRSDQVHLAHAIRERRAILLGPASEKALYPRKRAGNPAILQAPMSFPMLDSVTRNADDFEALHDLVVFAANGHHAGILVILFDNNPRNNMSAGDIARAVRNLEKAGVPIADSYHELNHWQ